jgi:hypothetical protein
MERAADLIRPSGMTSVDLYYCNQNLLERID